MASLIFVASLLLYSSARQVTPIVASNTSYGALDDSLNRDSCSSTRWTDTVVLWVCRDSQIVNATSGNPEDPSIANTASFSPLPNNPKNPETLVLTTPVPFGSLFYALEADECPPLGLCSDGSRWVGWPNTGPVVTFSFLGVVNAYAFMTRQHLGGLSVLETAGYSLYRVVSQHPGCLPTTSVEVHNFWSGTQIGYGTAASVLHNGYAYLYGATPNDQLAVARAKLGLLGALEDKSIYEYYVNGAWTEKVPLYNDTTIVLANTSAQQGTIYWSPKWESYVWIGGDHFPEANFYISTAPKPEGPWTAATLFYSGSVGNGSLPAYSAVAHPSLTDGTGDYIFITWTKTRPAPSGEDLYTTPLVRIDWE
ncbi:hypothetical protein C8R45DRAFT_883114 [Mycena sanguinolenta]|nr:hypothetical protein C8R45DRAFT_883114 [Mycena sanguinolenta]